MQTRIENRYSQVAVAALIVAAGALILLPTLAAAQEAVPGADDNTPEQTAGTEDQGFLFWSDASLSLLPWGTGFAVDPDEQSTITFEYAHESQIGDIFLFVDYNKFLHTDGDDTTWYAEIGPRFSLGKFFDTDLSRALFKKSLFEIKDVLFATQYERGEDPDVAEAVLLGVGFDLDVREAGLLGGLGKFNFVQLNFYGRNEMVEGAESGFRDAQITMVASYPFMIGKRPWLADGYFDWVVGFGDEDWSYHINPQVTTDLGAARNNPGKLFVGIELDFWWNKYQIPSSAGFDTDQAAISLLVKYHL
jgi:nucleoside-specific outer membrane channel protein Tsx